MQHYKGWNRTSELFCTWLCGFCFKVYQCSAAFVIFSFPLATEEVQKPVLRMKDGWIRPLSGWDLLATYSLGIRFCTPALQTSHCALQNLPKLALLTSKVCSPSQQYWGVQNSSLRPRWHLMCWNWQCLAILFLSRWTWQRAWLLLLFCSRQQKLQLLWKQAAVFFFLLHS